MFFGYLPSYLPCESDKHAAFCLLIEPLYTRSLKMDRAVRHFPHSFMYFTKTK